MLEEFRTTCQGEAGESMNKRCWRCEVSEEERRLRKCVICYKYYCDECAADRNGRTFCSKQCGDFFFFGDEE
jgi:hypothetical protein